MSRNQRVSGVFVTLVASAAWAGVLLQLWLSSHQATQSGHSALHATLVVLCYNTVLSNIFVALVATAVALGTGGWLTRAGTLAAAAVYIFVVGVIYSLLLRAQWVPEGFFKLADVLLHDVTPVLYVLWWLLCAPKGGLRWGSPVKWLAFPLAYFVLSLVAGAYSGRYLYPFGDVSAHGLAAVLRNGLLILVLYLGLGLAAVGIGRLIPTAPAR